MVWSGVRSQACASPPTALQPSLLFGHRRYDLRYSSTGQRVLIRYLDALRDLGTPIHDCERASQASSGRDASDESTLPRRHFVFSCAYLPAQRRTTVSADAPVQAVTGFRVLNLILAATARPSLVMLGVLYVLLCHHLSVKLISRTASSGE